MQNDKIFIRYEKFITYKNKLCILEENLYHLKFNLFENIFKVAFKFFLNIFYTIEVSFSS